MDDKTSPLSAEAPGRNGIRILIGLGILLRGIRYGFGGSLWHDEACLALNVVDRSYGELLGPLDYDQVAPAGFLFLQKGLVDLFGPAEPVLRLLPFLCGILSLFLFAALLRRILPPPWDLAPLALFAVSGPLVYHAAEAKPYAVDVAVGLALALAAWEAACAPDPLRRRRGGVAYVLLAGIGIWFSFASLFVTCGTLLWLAAVARREGGRALAVLVLAAVLLGGTSLAACYNLSIAHAAGHDVAHAFWGHGFLPYSTDGLVWLLETFTLVFENPGGIHMRGLAAWLFLLGTAVLAFSDRRTLGLILPPVGLAFLAAALHRYPFRDRLILFAVPFLLIGIGAGIRAVVPLAGAVRKPVLATLLLCLLTQPVASATYHAVRPVPREDLAPLLDRLRSELDRGDVVYVHPGAVPALDFYWPDALGESVGDWRVGTDPIRDPDRFAEDVGRLAGRKRVWILVSHLPPAHSEESLRTLERALDAAGIREETFRRPGARLYRYGNSDLMKRETF